EEAALLLDAPRLVDRARDRAEDAQRRPDQREAAGHADLQARLAERIELRGDEIETRREIPEDEREDGEPLLLARGDRSEQRDDQEQERKEREERVVRDGRRVRQIVAVDELDEPAPGGAAREPQLLRRSHSNIMAPGGSRVRWCAGAGVPVRGCVDSNDAPANPRTMSREPANRRTYERPKSVVPLLP